MDIVDTENYASRSEMYITELRELLAARGLPFGSARDVPSFLHLLNTGGSMHDEVVSTIRAISYREHESLSRPELVALILIAVGGSNVYASGRDGDSVRRINAFVTKTMAAKGNGAVSSTDFAAATPGEDENAQTLAWKQEVHAEEDRDRPSGPAPTVVRPVSSSSGIYSRARTMSDEPERIAAAAQSNFFAVTVGKEEGSDPEPFAAERTSGVDAHPPRRGIWLAAALATLLAVFGAALWRHRSPFSVEQMQTNTYAPSPDGAPVTASAGTASAQAQTPTPSATTASGVAQFAAGGPTPRSPQGGASSTSPQPPLGAGLPAAPPIAPSATAPAQPANDAQVATENAKPVGKPTTEVALERSSPPRTVQAAASTLPAAVRQGKFVVSSGVMSGYLLSAPAPSYPKMAKAWGVEGQVVLQAVVSSKGQVLSVRALDGHRLLRGSAEKAVRKWRYKPRIVSGKPTDVSTVVIVDYKLKP